MLKIHIVPAVFALVNFEFSNLAIGQITGGQGYKDAAPYTLSLMDSTADPCQDFFQYACGNYQVECFFKKNFFDRFFFQISEMSECIQ